MTTIKRNIDSVEKEKLNTRISEITKSLNIRINWITISILIGITIASAFHIYYFDYSNWSLISKFSVCLAPIGIWVIIEQYFKQKKNGNKELKSLTEIRNEGQISVVSIELNRIAKLEEYFRDESVIVHSNRLIDELFTFIYNNNRAEAMAGYNDDLVMSFAIGLWVRDTALRLRTEGIELTKKTLNRMQDIDGLYTPDENKNDSWDWEVNKKKESLEWLL